MDEAYIYGAVLPKRLFSLFSSLALAACLTITGTLWFITQAMRSSEPRSHVKIPKASSEGSHAIAALHEVFGFSKEVLARMLVVHYTTTNRSLQSAHIDVVFAKLCHLSKSVETNASGS